MPIPGITSSTLLRVAAFAKHHRDDHAAVTEEEQMELRCTPLAGWDLDFVDVPLVSHRAGTHKTGAGSLLDVHTSPHVRPSWAFNTCGKPNKIERALLEPPPPSVLLIMLRPPPPFLGRALRDDQRGKLHGLQASARAVQYTTKWRWFSCFRQLCTAALRCVVYVQAIRRSQYIEIIAIYLVLIGLLCGVSTGACWTSLARRSRN